MPQATGAYVFDAYGTLFDFHAAVARHHAAAGPDAAAFSELWRQKQIEYTWTHTLAGRYEEFWTLTQRALDYCFDRFPSVDRGLRDGLLSAYLKLDAYPDAKMVLGELKARGERAAILTNGSPAMIASAVEAAGLKSGLDAVFSVDAVKMFKPRPEVYALGDQGVRLQTSRRDVRILEPMGRLWRHGLRFPNGVDQPRQQPGRIPRLCPGRGRVRPDRRPIARALKAIAESRPCTTLVATANPPTRSRTSSSR